MLALRNLERENKKNRRNFFKSFSDLVAREGFEPSQAESESAVLPLHNLAVATFLLY